MKLFSWVIFVTLTIVIATDSKDQKNKIFFNLDKVDAEFRAQGSSLDILQKYDTILRNLKGLEASDDDVVRKILNVQYKHGLINYSMNREKLALSDYEACSLIEANGNVYFHNQCFTKFVELGISLAKVKEIKDMVSKVTEASKLGRIEISDADLAKVTDQIRWYLNTKELIERSKKEADWKKVVEYCDKLLEISYGDVDTLNDKVLALKNISDDQDLDFELKTKLLMDAYFNIVKYSNNNVDVFYQLAKLEMFGASDERYSRPGEATRLLKECLRIDNDYSKCRMLSRVNMKLDKVFGLIKTVSDYYSSVYAVFEDGITNGDLDWIKDKELNEKEWETIYEQLFYPLKTVKAKNELDRKAFGELNIDLDEYKSNFDLVIDLFVRTMETFGFKEHEIVQSKYIGNMFKLAKEAYFQSGEIGKYKKDLIVTQSRYYKKVNANNKKQGKDVVDYVVEFDKALKKQDSAKIQQLIQSMSRSFKATRLLHERISKFEEAQQHGRFQQQQQQQQQQQHHFYQRQQQQQQQQRQPGPNMKPDVDYYKVLGIDKSADQGEIKKAYREKMKQNHPDKMKGSDLSAEEIENNVAEINNAYEVLSDPEQKQRYDNFGNDAGGQSFHHGSGGSPFGGANFGANFGGFNFGGFNFGQQFQGQGGPRMYRRG